MRFVCSLFAGFGASLFVAGLASFVFGAFVLHENIVVNGLGPFDRVWNRYDYCFLGGVLASLGAGVLLVGWMNVPREPIERIH